LNKKKQKVIFEINCTLILLEPTKNELLEWLNSIKLAKLLPILQDLGVQDLEFLKLIEESDFEGTNIKPLQKRILFQAIKKLREDSAIKGKIIFTHIF
jgi:hypothetical protein